MTTTLNAHTNELNNQDKLITRIEKKLEVALIEEILKNKFSKLTQLMIQDVDKAVQVQKESMKQNK